MINERPIISRNRGIALLPHEINTQVDAELDEELVHLAEIGGVAVGVEEGGGGQWVPNVHAHYLRAAARGDSQNFHVLAVREWAQQQKPRH